jgi:Kef-type K+ transport system membrane component KefB
MWLPRTVYERVPQYWLVLGLLFMSSGMYLGFEYRLAYFYFGIGLICALWSMWTFTVRLRNRTTPYDAKSELTQPPLNRE